MADSDRAVVRRWCGTLTGDGWDTAEAAFVRLGSPYAAALELLQTRLSDFTWNVADLASASDRANHSRNIEALRRRISELVGVVLADDNITLSGEAERMFEQAQSGMPPKLVGVPYAAANARLA